MSNVPRDNRFTPADRSTAVKRLCEAMAMETADVIPARHRLAHLRSAAGAIGCNLDDLNACEEAELSASVTTSPPLAAVSSVSPSSTPNRARWEPLSSSTA